MEKVKEDRPAPLSVATNFEVLLLERSWTAISPLEDAAYKRDVRTGWKDKERQDTEEGKGEIILWRVFPSIVVSAGTLAAGDALLDEVDDEAEDEDKDDDEDEVGRV